MKSRMTNKLTTAELMERYRLQREIDRQSFRVHWKQVCFETLLSLLSNAGIGFGLGLVLLSLSVAPALGEIVTTVSKVCGQ